MTSSAPVWDPSRRGLEVECVGSVKQQDRQTGSATWPLGFATKPHVLGPRLAVGEWSCNCLISAGSQWRVSLRRGPHLIWSLDAHLSTKVVSQQTFAANSAIRPTAAFAPRRSALEDELQSSLAPYTSSRARSQTVCYGKNDRLENSQAQEVERHLRSGKALAALTCCFSAGGPTFLVP